MQRERRTAPSTHGGRSAEVTVPAQPRDTSELYRIAPQFAEQLRRLPGLIDVTSDLADHDSAGEGVARSRTFRRAAHADGLWHVNIYAFVGVIMLVGLVKKNGIMMTTMAALVGTLPIAHGWGTGAEARRPLGLAVVGGLLVSQTLTLYVRPVFDTYMEAFSERLRSGAFFPHGRKVHNHLDRLFHVLHRHPLEP